MKSRSSCRHQTVSSCSERSCFLLSRHPSALKKSLTMHFNLFTTTVAALAASLVSAGPIQPRADDVQPAFSGVLQSPTAGSSVAIGSNITFSYTPNVSHFGACGSSQESARFSRFLRLTDLLADRSLPRSPTRRRLTMASSCSPSTSDSKARRRS